MHRSPEKENETRRKSSNKRIVEWLVKMGIDNSKEVHSSPDKIMTNTLSFCLFFPSLVVISNVSGAKGTSIFTCRIPAFVNESSMHFRERIIVLVMTKLLYISLHTLQIVSLNYLALLQTISVISSFKQS